MEFKTIALHGRNADPRVAEPMQVLVEHLQRAGIDVITDATGDDDLAARQVTEQTVAKQSDMIIAVGGDGTMLHAARIALQHDVPLLGVNRGRLGFLADITPDEMLQSVDQVLAGDYYLENRLLLLAERHRDGAVDGTAFALNDVVLQRRETGRMVDFETRIGGRLVNAHSGDGLIIATPTGSTAYALSCGGPIIEPALDALVLVPICPHTLSDRPIVVPASVQVEVKVLRRIDTKAEVTVDGHTIGDLLPEDRLIVRDAGHRVRLIHPPGYDYYEILRSKLHWGRDSRQRNPAPYETD
ncbi:MAG: NAD(+) kinase [Woeseia sp.]|nr:NAD(+) kinase [Woeseia sp.]MBT8095406.1 NAD(+) kinase [Woeseia sp.]NNE61548.1 NAD(+) kinase [Woeseia sp.]NNL55167.1 NAD(+) kinase [Woeseia sp.]